LAIATIVAVCQAGVNDRVSIDATRVQARMTGARSLPAVAA
jgi:hypothetical protein